MNNKIINEQILATKLFILSLFISLSLTYNQKRNINNDIPFYSNKEAKVISVVNRIFVILIILFYIYIDNENLNFSKTESDKKLKKLQYYLEIIYLVAAIIALYITIKSSNSVTEEENPTI